VVDLISIRYSLKLLLLGPWVRGLKGVAQSTPAQMRVDLGGGQVPVSQQFLNNPDACAPLQKMGGEAVAQSVG
jgi:hypothetical protein